MTTLEARVSALENDVTVLLLAVQNIATTETLYTSLATTQMTAMAQRLKQLLDELRDDGDEWKL